MPKTWKEALKDKLLKEYGDKKGAVLSKEYIQGFPIGYTDDYTVDTAVNDIHYMLQLSAEKPLDIIFYLTPEKEYPLHLRLYQWQKPIALSDILPMLENLDLRTFNERP